jgi:hypothetical protein
MPEREGCKTVITGRERDGLGSRATDGTDEPRLQDADHRRGCPELAGDRLPVSAIAVLSFDRWAASPNMSALPAVQNTTEDERGGATQGSIESRALAIPGLFTVRQYLQSPPATTHVPGCHARSRFAFAFDPARASVIIVTMCFPKWLARIAAGERGGPAPSIAASAGSHSRTGAGMSSTIL